MNPFVLAVPQVQSFVYKHRLLEKYPEKEPLLEFLYKLLSLGDSKAFSRPNAFILKNAEERKKSIQEKNYKYIFFDDLQYPKELLKIYDPPLVLFYSGNLNILQNEFTAIVGTRKPSPFAPKLMRHLYEFLEKQSWDSGVVSGLALGIDAMAMSKALEKNIPLIGVLGTEISKQYPRQNQFLYRKMGEKDNCLLLTELLPMDAIGKWTFPKRNRIISGIAKRVILVETPSRSGALSCADSAISQHRDVYVIDDERLTQNAGGRKLIEDGAETLFLETSPVIPFDLNYFQKMGKDWQEFL